MQPIVTILGLYQYDNSLFDSYFTFPTDFTDNEKEELENELLSQCAELELLYPDYDTMAGLLHTWTRKERPIWDKLIATTQYTYNPIYNYDRTEIYKYGKTHTQENTLKNVQSGTVKNSPQEGTSGDTTTTARTAFNSEDYTNTEKITSSSYTQTDYNNLTSANSGTVTDTDGGQDEHEMYGNIGVTTTQQMIEAEREVVKFDIIQYIVDDFKARFCLLVY